MDWLPLFLLLADRRCRLRSRRATPTGNVNPRPEEALHWKCDLLFILLTVALFRRDLGLGVLCDRLMERKS